MLNFMGTGDCGAQEAFLTSVCFLLLFSSTYPLNFRLLLFCFCLSTFCSSAFRFFFLVSASAFLFLIFFVCVLPLLALLLLLPFPFFNALPCLASTLRFL